MGFDAKVFAGNYQRIYQKHQQFHEQRAEAAALIATQRNARRGLTTLRQKMAAAGLGTLGNSLTSSSDAEGSGTVHRKGDGWSASGRIHFRKKVSLRSIGAVEAYTQGAKIAPTGENGPWLWIATNQIPKRAGRFKMTPALYNKTGLDRKIGPLVRVKGPNGNPLLIVNTIGFNVAGRARSLNRSGGLRKGQVTQGSIVAFFGIPFTVRTRRINFAALGKQMQAELPADFLKALKDTA